MTKGIYHDLAYLYARLNAQYFGDRIRAEITWGKWGSARMAASSIRLGSYNFDKRLITIHPAMDQASVPRLCVERIIHHEMLHQKHPVRRGTGGRRLVHTPEFRESEKLFDGSLIADQWFEANLERILRYRPQHLKTPLTSEPTYRIRSPTKRVMRELSSLAGITQW